MAFKLGDRQALAGNVTTLNALHVGTAAQVERMVGYHAGRLRDGYFVALLKQAIGPNQFDFEGTTLRSGGKSGLPGTAGRVAVQDQILASLSQSHGDPARAEGALQALKARQLHGRDLTRGPKRLAKILPSIRHDANLSDAIQYPMGGGALQWKLTQKVQFLLAVFVDADGVAHTASPDPKLQRLDVNADHGLTYIAAREALRKYMNSA